MRPSNKIILILVAVILLSSPAQARRVKDIGVRYDEKGTSTQYAFVRDRWLPLRVVDYNGNLLEEYHYSKVPDGNGYLQWVKIRNIKTGEWIKLTSLESAGYKISVGENDIGIVDWFKIGEDTVKIGQLRIGNDGYKGNGVGLSVMNWIAKWVQVNDGIGKIVFLTKNPLAVSILEEISDVYNESYNYCRDLEHEGLPSNRRLAVLQDIEGFCVGEKGEAGTFKASDYSISIDGGLVTYSNWDALPEGTHIGRLNVLSDWTITFDGQEIGQVKSFIGIITLLGVTHPISIYIDNQGRIVNY